MSTNLLLQEHIEEIQHFFQEIARNFLRQHGVVEKGHQNCTEWNNQFHIFQQNQLWLELYLHLK